MKNARLWEKARLAFFLQAQDILISVTARLRLQNVLNASSKHSGSKTFRCRKYI